MAKTNDPGVNVAASGSQASPADGAEVNLSSSAPDPGVSVAASGSQASPADGAEVNLSSSAPTASTEEGVTTRVWDIRFHLGVSRRYTNRLASHYSSLDSFTTVISLIGGSAAFAQAFSVPGTISLYASLVVVIVTAVKLGFRWPDKARLFTDLYQRYTRLQESLVRIGASPADADLLQIKAEYILIEAAEPATKNNLFAICHNEEITAQGADQAGKHKLNKWQRWFAPFITLPPFSWE